ncbi:MAG: MFS transporter [Dehalococcoidia bacterium]
MDRDPGIPNPEAVATAARSGGGFARMFQALAYRDFRLIWLTQLTNSAANWMQMVALPILVINLFGGDLAAASLHVGLVATVRTAPAMVLGLFSGVVADMWNRKRILLTTRVLVTALSVWFATTIVLGSVTLVEVYAFSLIRGATMAFDNPPRRAMIPSVVPHHVVTNAMALLTGSQQIMRIIAAGAGGLMIAIAGPGSLFVTLAVLYFIGIPLVLALRVQDHERSGYQGMAPIFRDIKEALAFAWSTPAVRGVLTIAVFFFIFGIAFMQVFAPLLAKGPMGVGNVGFGIIVALMGLGGTIGTLFIAYISPSKRRGITLLLSMGTFGGMLIILALSTYYPYPLITYLLVLVLGVGHSVFQPLITTILLQSAPSHMRGRVMALLSYDRALVSMGAAVAGFTAAAFGPQLAQILFGATCILVTAVLVLGYRPLRQMD